VGSKGSEGDGMMEKGGSSRRSLKMHFEIQSVKLFDVLVDSL